MMAHLRNAKAGKRILLIGNFVPKKGYEQNFCLRMIERSLIKHYLLEGHNLVNVQGTKLKRHEIISTGGGNLVPKIMFIER